MRLLIAWFALLVPAAFAGLPAGDDHYTALHYDEAVSAYVQVLERSPDDPGALWRLARVHISMGDVAAGDARERHFREAERYARRCTQVDSLVGAGHTWLAAALGNIAMYEGSKTKVRLANEIRHELEVALALNPHDDIALSILGSFYRALGNVSWIERRLASIFLGSLPEGGYEESETALMKAIALAPRVLRHQFELGLLYMDWGRDEEARAVLEKCRSLPVLVASDIPTQDETRRLIAELQ